MFVDEVIIKVQAGRGGDGCSSMHREKYIEFGGPDGGNGGKGGDIVFTADSGLHTLIDLRYQKHIKGDNGKNGMGNNRQGARGEDTIIKVPVGTTVIDNENGYVLCDLTKHGESHIVCVGGKGGRGNASFKTNRNNAPTVSEYGEEGELRQIKCELKLLADIGLVGLPSVGKSSIISVISASKPKIADYPFTTLNPNLGVVKCGTNSFVVADLPGLIEGASEGVGLGDKFLKHISRTKAICHVLDMSSSTVCEDYEVILNELRKYSEKLIMKKSIIVANKMDLEESKENLKLFKEKYKDLEVIEISAATKMNIDKLIYKLNDLVLSTEDEEIYNDSDYEDYVLYKFKEEKPFTVEKVSDNYFRISGEELEKLLKKTRFNGEEAAVRFANKLKRMGIDEELERNGIEEGDTVAILDFEFEYRKGL